MAVNKSFVIKNGLEVNTDLILADANTNKVGIGSTGPRFELDVAGGIGATDLYVSGISTVISEFNVGTDGSVLTVLGVGGSVGVGTALPGYLLEVRSPVSTGQTALYVYGDLGVSGDLNIDDINLDQANINKLYVTQNLDVTGSGTLYVQSGVSTFSGYLDANSDVDIDGTLNVGGATTVGGYLDVNAASDISGTVNISGITTVGGYLDVNAASDISGTLNVGGATTVGGYLDVNAASDISGTVNISGITTVGGYLDVNADTDVNGTLNVSGITTIESVLISSGIVTATSPSGIVTYYGDGSQLLGVTGGIGIGTTGGTVGYGITFLNLFGSGVSTTQYDSSVGIATIFFERDENTVIPGGSDSQVQYNNGGLFGGSSNFTFNDLTNSVTIGSTVTINSSGDINATGVVTATSFVGNLNGSATGLLGTPNLNVGIVTATSFFGNGSGLTGTGSTVFNDISTNQEYYILFTNITAGTITSSGISTSKLTYNPSTGTITAVDVNSTSDINLKTNVRTVENSLGIVQKLRGVSFDWKETGNSSYGVIAQELEEVLPELVKNSDVKSVNYNGIIGVLIEAIKELKKEIEVLKINK